MCHLVLSLYNSFEFLYYAEENTEKTKKSDKKICFFFFFFSFVAPKNKIYEVGFVLFGIVRAEKEFFFCQGDGNIVLLMPLDFFIVLIPTGMERLKK